jgi:uncharacterized protein (DUF433 family)
MIDNMETPTTTQEPHYIPPAASVEHIVATPGVCGGKPRIAGHRIRVQDIALWHERVGYSVAEIVAHYCMPPSPTITITAKRFSRICGTQKPL